MSVIPPNVVSRIDEWEDIKTFGHPYGGTREITCGICKGTKDVKMGRVPHIAGCAMVHPIYGDPLYWRLCASCHQEGWKPMTAHYGKVTFMNVQTLSIQMKTQFD